MFSPFNPFDQEAKDVYQFTRSRDNPVPFPDWVDNLAFQSNLKNFISKVPPKSWFRDMPYYESLYMSPKAIRYQMDSVGRVTYPGTRPGAWRVELARFPVPQRYTGIVRGFEQWLGVVTVQGTINSVIAYGNPFVDSDANILGTWFMRLFPFDGTMRPWINQLNPNPEQPGIPYSDFPQQTGVWFPTHSDAAESVRFPVPGGYELSIFWESAPTISAIPVVSAAFKGGIQSAFSPRALDQYLGSWS
jgi:hypothetical protein